MDTTENETVGIYYYYAIDKRESPSFGGAPEARVAVSFLRPASRLP